MAKKTATKIESKNYDITVVYDVFHDVDKPISASMFGKIRKKRIRLTLRLIGTFRSRKLRRFSCLRMKSILI